MNNSESANVMKTLFKQINEKTAISTVIGNVIFLDLDHAQSGCNLPI